MTISRREACKARVEAQFSGAVLEATGRRGSTGCPAFAALAVLLGYLEETQKKGVERLKTVHNYAEAQYMQLSPVTRAKPGTDGNDARAREKRYAAVGAG